MDRFTRMSSTRHALAAGLLTALLFALPLAATPACATSKKDVVLVHSYGYDLRAPSDRLCFLLFYEAFSAQLTKNHDVFLSTRHNPASNYAETDDDIYVHCRILRDVFYLDVGLSQKSKDPINQLRRIVRIIDIYGYKTQLEDVLASSAKRVIDTMDADTLSEMP